MVNVKAESGDIYYMNNNGVSFTKEQYDFFTAMYYDGYQTVMQEEDFNYYNLEDMKTSSVESKIINGNLTRGTSITDSNKTLKISKSSNGSYSNVVLVLTWNAIPSIKSYDVMGARLSGVELKQNPITKVVYGNSTSSESDLQIFSNGFGASILLPQTNSTMTITQTFKTSTNGTVYGSYQHASSRTTLAYSKKYTINSSGYGGVFNFDYIVRNIYDGMNGVSISV